MVIRITPLYNILDPPLLIASRAVGQQHHFSAHMMLLSI